MKIKQLILGFLCFLISIIWQVSHAKIKITDISLIPGQDITRAVVGFEGEIKNPPVLSAQGGFVQLTFDDATVWPKIDKKTNLKNSFDTTLTAYQYSSGVVRFRAIFPVQDLSHATDSMGVILSDNKVVLTIPTYHLKPLEQVKKEKKTEVVPDAFLVKVENEILQEEKKIETENTLAKEENDKKTILSNPNMAVEKMRDPMAEKENLDKTSSGHGLSSYVGKFLSFLGLVLLVFMAIMKIFKKGFANKSSKLGILTSNDALSVLKSIYVGPKKSLMMVKAHNQVFLIGSSDSGIHFLSEIKDVVGIVKEGEFNLSGANFDSGLNRAEEKAELGLVHQVLKEDITQSTPERESVKKVALDGLKDLASQMRDSVKISDQIKSKVKSLRPMQ